MIAKHHILMIMLLLGFVSLEADEVINSRTVDSLSYRYYQEQKWDSLLWIGKIALDHHIDFYYLRMRMGIAEFERERYIAAERHFEKALFFDDHSYPARSYLYFARDYGGKQSKALRFSRTFSEQQLAEQGIRIPKIASVTLLGGYSLSNNFSGNGALDLLGSDGVMGTQLLMGNMAIASAGLTLNLSRSFRLSVSLTNEWVQTRNRFQYQRISYTKTKRPIGQNGSYVNDFKKNTSAGEIVYNSSIRQTELYLNPAFQFDRGFSLGLFANMLFIRSSQYNGQIQPETRVDTLRYNAITGIYTPVVLQETDFASGQNDTTFVNFTTGIYLVKDFGYFTMDLTGSYSRLYQLDQFQSDFSITYYPLGSLKLYGITGIGVYFTPGTEVTERQARLLFNQRIGVGITKRLWLEGEYWKGNLKNVNIRRGLVVFNLPDEIDFVAALKLTYFSTKHLVLYFRYDFAAKSGGYLKEKDLDGKNPQVITFDYQTQNFIGGLQWKF